MQSTDKKQRERLAQGLSGMLADTYALYHATQACHWNVQGPQFHTLHAMFEKQYRELAEAVDVIAERIRAIGFYTPATLSEMMKMTRVRESGDLRGSTEMLSHLIEAHMQVVHRANEVREDAEKALDEATADLLIERMRIHEKTLWMLRSQADRDSAELAPVRPMAKTG